jgi:hypothetical protein
MKFGVNIKPLAATPPLYDFNWSSRVPNISSVVMRNSSMIGTPELLNVAKGKAISVTGREGP